MSVNSIYDESVAVRQLSEYYSNKAHRFSDQLLDMSSRKISDHILPLGKYLIKSEDVYDAVNGNDIGVNFNNVFEGTVSIYTWFDTDVYNNEDTTHDPYNRTRLDRTLIGMCNTYGYTVTDINQVPAILAPFTSYSQSTIDDEIFYSDTGQGQNPLILLRVMYDFMQGMTGNQMGRWAEYRDGEMSIYEGFDIHTRLLGKYKSLIPVTTKTEMLYISIDEVLDLMASQNALGNLTSEFISSVSNGDALSYIDSKIKLYCGESNTLIPMLTGLNRTIHSDQTLTPLQKIKGWIDTFAVITTNQNLDAFCNVDTQGYSGISLSQVVMGEIYSQITQTYEAFKQLNVSSIAAGLLSLGSGALAAYRKGLEITALLYYKPINWMISKSKQVYHTIFDPIDISINTEYDDHSFDEGYTAWTVNNASTRFPSLVNRLNENVGQYLCVPLPGVTVYIGTYSSADDSFIIYLKFQLLPQEAMSSVISAFGISENALEKALQGIPNYKSIDKVETSAEEVNMYQSIIYSKVAAYLVMIYLTRGFNYIFDKMNNTPTWYISLFEDLNSRGDSPAAIAAITSVTNLDFINEVLHFSDYDDIKSDFINFLDYNITNASEFIPYFTIPGQLRAKYHVLTDSQNMTNAIHTLILIAVVVTITALAIAGVALGVKLKHATQESRWTADMLAFGGNPADLDIKSIRKAQRKANFLEKITGSASGSTAASVGLITGITQKISGQDDADTSFTSVKDVFSNVNTKTQNVITDLRSGGSVNLSSVSTQISELPDNTNTINNIDSALTGVSEQIRDLPDNTNTINDIDQVSTDTNFNVGALSGTLRDVKDIVTAQGQAITDLQRKVNDVEDLIH